MAQADIREPVFSSTNRGGTKMELNGFLYNKDRAIESNLYWRCEDRQCKGRVITLDNIPVKTTSHTTHGPCKFEGEVQKSLLLRDVNKIFLTHIVSSNFRHLSTKFDEMVIRRK